MDEYTVEVKANVKDVNTKNLVSGDKEVRVLLSIVGEDALRAIDIGKLEPVQTVRVIYSTEPVED